VIRRDDALRIAFGVAALVALLLGYVGLAEHLRQSPEYQVWDVLYYDFQLFVLGSTPLEEHGPFPAPLQVARFIAPVVTVYTIVEGVRVFSTTEFRRLRARKARGHVVVSGDTPLAAALSRRLRSEGRRVVDVRPVATGGRLVVTGDVRDPAVLRAAGAGRATALYACEVDSAANIATALAAGQLRRSASHPLKVYAHIRDPDLCLSLQARYLGLPQPAGLRLAFFNADDLAARKLFEDEPLSPEADRPPRLLIAGDGVFARAVVLEAARHWRQTTDEAAPLPITLVSETAQAAHDELTGRYPFLRLACRFTVHAADLLQLLADRTRRDPPSRAFICHEDEEHALKTAMTAKQFWRGRPHTVVVRLDQLAGFRDGLDPTGHGRLFAEASGALRAYGVNDAASDPQLIGEDLVEQLARVIHERYRAARRQRGDDPQVNRAMVRWEELPDAMRRNNREQAEDIGRKLREIGCSIVPRLGPWDGGGLDEAEIEKLAQMEHERWRRQYAADGWQYAEERDYDRKYHPGLRDWPELSEQMRLRNHDAVREVPMILADAGFQIVRLS
jgi:voltage-gated potassium channel Kch